MEANEDPLDPSEQEDLVLPPGQNCTGQNCYDKLAHCVACKIVAVASKISLYFTRKFITKLLFFMKLY